MENNNSNHTEQYFTPAELRQILNISNNQYQQWNHRRLLMQTVPAKPGKGQSVFLPIDVFHGIVMIYLNNLGINLPDAFRIAEYVINHVDWENVNAIFINPEKAEWYDASEGIPNADILIYINIINIKERIFKALLR